MFSPRLLFLILMTTLTALTATAASPQFVYFGTSTRSSQSKGIYVARLDAQTGALTEPTLAAEAATPGFLARHPTLPVLYAAAVSRDGASAKGKGKGANAGGVVIAYKINPETGALTLLNQVDAGPTGGTHISVTPDGRTALTAHYGGGYVNSFSIRADGSLGESVSRIQHTMTGTHRQQNAPHPHWMGASPDGRFAFVADLSADKIFSYRIGAGSTLEDQEIAASVKSESGARHLAFSPNGKRLYLLNELAASVTAFDYDAATGALTEIQTVSIVPPDFSKRRWSAEIVVHPSGKFLYASNRADDESIAAFAIDAATGKLSFVQRTGSLALPRHFAVSPNGRWLLCANHDANEVVVFAIDAATGKLSEPLGRASVPASICVLFWPVYHINSN
jgi:6-phosphogluconolactonase